ncbi:hypothetical protein C8J56DRAFT_801639, partial [Mycena floridula]
YMIRDFWRHVKDCETWGTCHHCQVTETMEHILLECQRSGQHELWNLAQLLWSQTTQIGKECTMARDEPGSCPGLWTSRVQ